MWNGILSLQVFLIVGETDSADLAICQPDYLITKIYFRMLWLKQNKTKNTNQKNQPHKEPKKQTTNEKTKPHKTPQQNPTKQHTHTQRELLIK